MVFLSQKVDGNMIFTDYWKGLVLTFSEMGNTVFFWAKKLTEIWYLLITGKFLFWTFRWWEIRSFFESRSWWKDDIYWLLRSSCFELFGDGKYGLFFSQKVDGKMIFTWSFWAFHDIPGLGKDGFLCSDDLQCSTVLAHLPFLECTVCQCHSVGGKFYSLPLSFVSSCP